MQAWTQQVNKLWVRLEKEKWSKFIYTMIYARLEVCIIYTMIYVHLEVHKIFFLFLPHLYSKSYTLEPEFKKKKN